jgi:hypothetical protein
MNSVDLVETLERWKDGTLAGADLERLNQALESADFRTRLVDTWLLDHSLPGILARHSIQAHLPAPGTSRRVLRNPLLKTFGAAAAGLLLGLFSASYVFGKAAFPHRKVVPLLNESFESGPTPGQNGIPVMPNRWSGDISRLVDAQQGVQPNSGKRMLQLCRADYEGKHPGFSYSADVYRIVPIPKGLTGLGETSVTCEAQCSSVPFAEAKRYGISLILCALDALPDSAEPGAWKPGSAQPEPHPSENAELVSASARRSLSLDPRGMTWQPLRLEMKLPAGTRYLLISFHLADHQAGRNPRESGATEFSGHFLDSIQVNLVQDASASNPRP